MSNETEYPFQLTPEQSSRYRPDRVDHVFLAAHDVKVVWHQPWQVSLFHPDTKNKLVWYPGKGTLMVEPPSGYGRRAIGDFYNSEDVYDHLQKVINGSIN